MAGQLVDVIGAEEVDRAYAALSTVSDSFRRAMVRASNEVRIAMRREVSKRFKKGKGYLERSVGYKLVQTPYSGIESWIKPRAFYAPTLEFGKTIYAKNAQFMRFPLMGGASGATIYARWKSAAMKHAYAASKRGHRAKDWRDYVTGYRGTAEQRAGAAADVSWRRVKSVTIAPHPFVEPTAKESEGPVAEILGDGFVAAFAVSR